MPKDHDGAQLKSSFKLKVPCTDSRESPIVRGALCGIGGARSKTPYRCGLPVLKRRSSTIALFPERCDEKIENVVGLLLLLIKLYWDSYRNAQES